MVLVVASAERGWQEVVYANTLTDKHLQKNAAPSVKQWELGEGVGVGIKKGRKKWIKRGGNN